MKINKSIMNMKNTVYIYCWIQIQNNEFGGSTKYEDVYFLAQWQYTLCVTRIVRRMMIMPIRKVLYGKLLEGCHN